MTTTYLTAIFLKEESMPSIEEIEKSWSLDNNIDELKLVEASTNSPKLNQKYYSMLVKELYKLQMVDDEVRELEHYLDLFYQDRLTDAEYKMLGWTPLAKVPATAQERSRSVNIDPRMVELKLKQTRQKLKCDYLKEVTSQINNRQWIIRNINEVRRFEAGG